MRRVLPSFAEGMPIVLMEAMAMEVPVVANAVTGIVEFVDNGDRGLPYARDTFDGWTQRLAKG